MNALIFKKRQQKTNIKRFVQFYIFRVSPEVYNHIFLQQFYNRYIHILLYILNVKYGQIYRFGTYYKGCTTYNWICIKSHKSKCQVQFSPSAVWIFWLLQSATQSSTIVGLHNIQRFFKIRCLGIAACDKTWHLIYWPLHNRIFFLCVWGGGSVEEEVIWHKATNMINVWGVKCERKSQMNQKNRNMFTIVEFSNTIYYRSRPTCTGWVTNLQHRPLAKYISMYFIFYITYCSFE